jgi:membrane associated rhomboid family serine protease
MGARRNNDSMVKQVLQEQAPLVALIVVIALIFFLQLVLGHSAFGRFMVVPRDVVAAWESLRQGDLTGEMFRAFSTTLSSAFLHGNIEHLLYNMFFLWIFAALTAELLGHRWMLTLFVVTAIAGSVVHTILNSSDWIPMLGASGAVMGFEGAYLGLALRWRLPDPHIWPMARPIPPAHLCALAVVGIALDFSGIMNHEATNIAYGAHIGGFLAGLILASTVIGPPRVTRD